MSALGHKRTLRYTHAMSALPPIGDIDRQFWNVRFVPKADIRRADAMLRRCRGARGPYLLVGSKKPRYQRGQQGASNKTDNGSN
jgi:hypothetical protein